jgi:hypothetical protein
VRRAEHFAVSLRLTESPMGRVCPGKYLADRQGFQILASILWAFRIDPIEGETRLQLQDVKFVDSLVTYVHPIELVHQIKLLFQTSAPFPVPLHPEKREYCSLLR